MTLNNTGSGAVSGLDFNDTLPSGFSWQIVAADTSTGWSIVGNELQYAPTTLAGNSSTTVHITSVTDPADCGIVTNTASFTSTNAGTGSQTATATVQCPNIDVVKTADASPVSAGATIGFKVKISNAGPGTATGLTFSDTLPSGFTWTIVAADTDPGWSIVGDQLVFSGTSMASGADSDVHVTAVSDPADCGIVSNTATFDADNDAQETSTATVTVQCPNIDVVKTADASPVSAGATIGFKVKISNAGPGTATGLTFSDTLPAGFTWQIVALDTDPGWSIVGNELLFSGTSMASGADSDVHVTAVSDPADCGIVSNTATFDADNDAQETSTATVTVQCPNIDVVKTADASPVSAGATIGFKVKISNAGPGTATGLTFSDTLPSGLPWQIVAADTDPGWSIVGNQLVFSGTSMASGADSDVHVTAVTDPADCGMVSNTATFDADNDDQETSTATVTVQCPNIDVTKVADNDPVNAGAQIGFVVTISNAGPGTATGLTFSDPLPAGFTWSIATPSAGWSIVNGNLVYSPTTLGSGASSSVHVVATSDPADCGLVSNTATLDADNDDQETATDTVTVNCPNIDVTKVADDSVVSAGAQIGFVVTISNTGAGTATGLTFSDPLPAGFTWSIATPSAGWSIVNGNLVYSPTTLAANSSSSVHVIATSDPADCGLVSNTATLDADNDDQETATDTVDVNCPGINVDKVADDDTINAGQQIGFVVTISNTGAGTATGLTFSDPLPAGFSWQIVAADTDAGWSIVNGNLTYSPTSLAANTSSSVHVISTTDPADCGIVSNTATFDADNDDQDTATDTVTVQCPNIDVVKTADASPVSAGATIGFKVKISNAGPGTATGLTFSDTLPAGFTWTIVAADTDPGWSIVGNQLQFSGTSMASGADSDVHVIAVSDPADCGVVSNTATFDADNDAEETATATVTVQCPDIDVTKTADAAEVSAGEEIGFTVTIFNNGPGTATGLAFTDVLPAGLNWTIDAANSDTGWQIVGGSLQYTPTTLAGNTSKKVHIVADTDGEDCGLKTNTATFDASNDDQETATATTEVKCADIDVDKVADNAEVSAGEQVGFVVTLSNDGTGEAKGLQFTDDLPSGFNWSIVAADSDPGWSIVNGDLVFSPTTLAGNTSSSVHVVAISDAADCGLVNNTASISTSNDGSDSQLASVEVKCADIDVDKVADKSPISAGEQIGFVVTLSNDGTGEAKGLSFTDVLPAGFNWSIATPSAGWSIANGSLVYSPTTLAGNTSTSVHVVAVSDAADCGLVTNTASIGTSNDGSDSQAATVDVDCPDIDVVKTADDDAVSAGDQIGFTVTLSNAGDGEAKGLQFTDALPTGGGALSWSIETPSAGWSINGGNLVYSPSTLAPHSSTSVHVVADTVKDDCGTIDNTATLTASNDATESSSDSVEVRCGAIDLTKTADADSVNAGSQIGFVITATNTGAGEVRDVTVTDTLPSNAGLSWSIDAANSDVGCSITGGTLTCNFGTIALGRQPARAHHEPDHSGLVRDHRQQRDGLHEQRRR